MMIAIFTIRTVAVALFVMMMVMIRSPCLTPAQAFRQMFGLSCGSWPQALLEGSWFGVQGSKFFWV